MCEAWRRQCRTVERETNQRAENTKESVEASITTDNGFSIPFVFMGFSFFLFFFFFLLYALIYLNVYIHIRELLQFYYPTFLSA